MSGEWDYTSKLTPEEWQQIYKEMLSGGNKTELLNMIKKVTDIDFSDIMLERPERTQSYKITLYTPSRQALSIGFIDKYIASFSWSMHYRDPEGPVLSFCPALSYKLRGGGSNGFDVRAWFYYNIEQKKWIVKQLKEYSEE